MPLLILKAVASFLVSLAIFSVTLYVVVGFYAPQGATIDISSVIIKSIPASIVPTIALFIFIRKRREK